MHSCQNYLILTAKNNKIFSIFAQLKNRKFNFLNELSTVLKLTNTPPSINKSLFHAVIQIITTSDIFGMRFELLDVKKQ